jgi:hypothetical protein
MAWFRKVRLNGGASIVSLAYTTRAVIRSTTAGDNSGIGSIAISTTDGRMHVKIADNNADNDWRKVTVTDAD